MTKLHGKGGAKLHNVLTLLHSTVIFKGLHIQQTHNHVDDILMIPPMHYSQQQQW